jgi:hypothetical protein
MERQHPPLSLSEKLITAAAIDYPAASEIIVSFPDAWQLVATVRGGDTPLYVAGMPRSVERSHSDHFYGLSPEINRSLTTYRLYKLFEPRTVPQFHVAWNSHLGQGHIIGGAELKIHLHPLGQAQSWQGDTYGLIWECYLFEAYRQRPTWPETLTAFWRAVETGLQTAKIFTEPREPTFESGYLEFLSRLGYTPDPGFEEGDVKSGKIFRSPLV